LLDVVAVAHQTAGRRISAPIIDRRYAEPSCKFDNLLRVTDKRWSCQDKHCIGLLTAHSHECRFEFTFGGGIEYAKLQSKAGGRTAGVSLLPQNQVSRGSPTR